MPLSAAQTPLYWRTWAAIAAALHADQPEATKAEIAKLRHSQHKAARCPASSKAWKNADLNRWILWAKILQDPDNLALRLEFEEAAHPEAARIYVIRQLLAKLGKPVPYAAACAHRADLPPDLCKWPAEALQAALQALQRTSRLSQLPGKDPF